MNYLNVSFGDGWYLSPSCEEQFIVAAIRRCRIDFQSKTNLKVHVVWIPKYRKKVLHGIVSF